MYILGISAFYHDSAACLISDGCIVAAAQEERFTRKKHDERFPSNAIKYCLAQIDLDPSEIDSVVFYEKPFLKFERILETYLAFAPRGFKHFLRAIPIWLTQKLFQKSIIIKELKGTFGNTIDWHKKLLFCEHHISHAASAFFPSPFDRAAVLTLDGVGEWATTSLSLGEGNQLKVIKEINFPHSLGLLYSAFTYYLGFKVNSGEYKMMGLAPYGEPKYVDLIKDNLITILDDGSFHLNMDYFDFCTGLRMTSSKFHLLFEGEPRQPEAEINQYHMDLASSVQKVTEEILIRIAKKIAIETGEKNLCLAGGVALNCVANGQLLKEGIFENIWVQPAAGDAGGALGSALAVWYMHLNKHRPKTTGLDAMQGAFLGPSFSDDEVEKTLKHCGAIYQKFTEEILLDTLARELSEGKAIGFFQGRMEFGPRALGGRSIIADARSEFMQKQLNLKIKFRESFRPFAPSILKEHSSDWFEYGGDSPYMLFVSHLKDSKRQHIKGDKGLKGIQQLGIPRSTVPAITHVDYSARLQTVHHETNPKYHALITKFYNLTSCPLVVNTSFNVRGEPIVCTPEDAFRCFMGTDLDILAIGNFLLFKKDQNAQLLTDYTDRYAAD